MYALETRPLGNPPTPYASKPWHPEVRGDFDNFEPLNLPEYIAVSRDETWVETGFTITSDKRLMGTLLLSRFERNPAVGYAFDARTGMVIEFEKVAKE